MGWASGSGLFSELIEVIKDNVESPSLRKEIYRGMMESFETYDCDTLDECYGVDPAYDELWDELYPDQEEDYFDVDDHFGQD